MTDTESDKNKEARGQGIANIVSGFFGGMAGCAMIGQSGINVKSGGRGRLSTFVAGALFNDPNCFIKRLFSPYSNVCTSRSHDYGMYRYL